MSSRDEVLEMWAAGITDARQIAAEVGISSGNVYMILRDAGLGSRKPGRKSLSETLPAGTIEEIIYAYSATTEPAITIVRRFGISFTALYKILDDNDVPLRAAQKNEIFEKQMTHAVQLYVDGEKLKRIYIETGIHAPQLYEELEMRGIELRKVSEF